MTGLPRPARTATAAAAVAVAALCLTPLVYLFADGVSLDDIRQQFHYPDTLTNLGQSIALTAAISALSVVLGVGCALLVDRTTLPMPRLFTVLFAMPLAVPGFVSAYAAYSAELTFAPHLELVTSFPGAALVMALSLYPYVFLPCVVALRSVDPALEEVVASLRRRRGAALWQVTLPALRPALGTGVLIVALHALAEYGGMVQLGRSTLTTRIMGEMLSYGDYRSARSLALVLAGLSVAVLLATGALTGPGRTGHVARGSTRPPRRRDLKALRHPVAAAGLLVPLAAVGPTVAMTTRGLAHAHGTATTDWHHVGTALATTLGYALAAALAATVIAWPIAHQVTRRPSALSTLTERATWIAHAIPSAILGLSLVYLATRLVPALYKTPVVLVAGYVILFLPLAIANQRIGLDACRSTYDDVAASLGTPPLRVFWRVGLPLALPGFLTGALLVGLDASKELTTTLMLIPFNTHTLSTELWATTNGESLDFTAAAPYAAMLVLLGAAPVYFIVRHTLRHLTTPPATQAAATTDPTARAERTPAAPPRSTASGDG